MIVLQKYLVGPLGTSWIWLGPLVGLRHWLNLVGGTLGCTLFVAFGANHWLGPLVGLRHLLNLVGRKMGCTLFVVFGANHWELL